jgi:hypothetical protein
MRDYQHSTLIRQSNDNESMLSQGMVWVGVSIGKSITEYRRGLFERNVVLGKIACSFLLIPAKRIRAL